MFVKKIFKQNLQKQCLRSISISLILCFMFSLDSNFDDNLLAKWAAYNDGHVLNRLANPCYN